MESLPDEILLKIVKMATNSPVNQCLINTHNGICGHKRTCDGLHDPGPDICTNKHDILIDSIMGISKRFKRIAESPEFWRGAVNINLIDTTLLDARTLEHEPWRIDITEHRRPQKYELVKHLLSGETKELFIMGSDTNIDLLDLSATCNNLDTLLLNGLWINSWPNLPHSWSSLSELFLMDLPSSPFENVKLQLPKLRRFDLSAHSAHIRHVLPDMTQCAQLEKVYLGPGQFAFTNSPMDNLPRGLKDFWLMEGRFYDREDDMILSYSEAQDMMDQLEDYMDDCGIDLDDGYQDFPEDVPVPTLAIAFTVATATMGAISFIYAASF